MSDHKGMIRTSLDVMRQLENLDLSTQTIRYMAMIAMEDSAQEENYYAENIFRRIVRYCNDPERRASVEARQQKRLEEAAQ